MKRFEKCRHCGETLDLQRDGFGIEGDGYTCIPCMMGPTWTPYEPEPKSDLWACLTFLLAALLALAVIYISLRVAPW